MDSLVEKEVLEDAGTFVSELEQNSEYKVTVTRKKFVEQPFYSITGWAVSSDRYMKLTHCLVEK